MENLEIAYKALLEKKQKEIDLMKLLNSSDGFYQYFFKICNEYKTREDAFDAVNNLYFELFGRFRYKSYKGFRNSISQFYKK